ncbi:hypothetical protein AK812_SmicGene26222 [Symbiodinium microadriaticum]|uniref:Uncharacterized protein n=1 Tax=Symbiodinium microadriaticum TaxID=2951 RepID=A0A1Q9DA30_SYMMI|nr:hypothetical protein AK812_SmicGene26222 [Symbiodinium microadriaticum]
MLVVTLWVSMGLKPKVTVHMMTVMVFLIPMVVLKIMRGMKTTMKGPGLASAGFAVDEHDDDAACDDAVGDTSETLMRLKLMFIMHRMAIVRAAPVTKEDAAHTGGAMMVFLIPMVAVVLKIMMASVRAAPVTKEVTLIRVMLVIFGNDDAVRRDDVNVCCYDAHYDCGEDAAHRWDDDDLGLHSRCGIEDYEWDENDSGIGGVAADAADEHDDDVAHYDATRVAKRW